MREMPDRMKAARNVAVAFVVLGLLVVPVVWLRWPAIRAWREISSGIDAIQIFGKDQPVTAQRSYSANTLASGISSQTIKRYYDRAATALVAKGPTAKTYRWVDLEGWDRLSTVLQMDTGYIEVRASCNNDNDSMFIGITPGEFGRPDAEVLPTHELPSGMLRYDWHAQN